MVKMSALYQGNKSCQIRHEPSQTVLETDAPLDNGGRGSSFSPTDLIASALASCALTIMANMAEKDGLDIRGARADVTKEMVENPRRIRRLAVHIYLSAHLSLRDRARLEAAAEACPVHKSLHPDIEAPLIFHYV